VATLASLLDVDYSYPHDILHHIWQLVCLNQFHDIIPGSSIRAVYVESDVQYAEIQQLGKEAQGMALAAIARQTIGDVLIINATSFQRDDLALWRDQLPPTRHFEQLDGTPVMTQATEQGMLIAGGPWPAYSITPLLLAEGELPQSASSMIVTPTLLENECLRVELNEAGDIVRIYDKGNAREVLAPGALANQFQVFEDRPIEYDAWNIDIYYDDKMWTADPATSVKVIESGPVRATIEIQRQILHSNYVQRLSLSRNRRRLDFDTTINWCERHVLLKVAFVVDILSPLATYEIQWGNIQRPTHRNTSWDWARFETCAQKWVDLSEGDYGVSLLNDCKNGHDIFDNNIRLSLLRSPTYPDTEADQGQHHFTYSFLPHSGDWSDTIGEAYALNDPLIVYRVDKEHDNDRADVSVSNNSSLSIIHNQQSIISTDRPNIVIETIKRAEDNNGIIVRLYESQRKRGPVVLSTSFPLSEVWRTDLLEQDKEKLEMSGNSMRLEIRPYQIVTLRLIPA